MGPFKIQWMTPLAPSCQVCYLLDQKPFRVGIIADNKPPCHPEDFKVELWTNLYHKNDNEGEWHAIDMVYQNVRSVRDNGQVVFFYGVELIVTCLGRFDFTYRARHKFDHEYQWASWFTVDGHLEVRRQTDKVTTWVQEPEASKITHNIYIGNYTAAVEAPETGYDCMLNLSAETPVFPEQLTKPIIFQKYLLPFGPDHEISEEIIADTVVWLRAMSDRCHKIMVASKDGHGRAGSIMIAFIFAVNPNLTFEEAHKFVDTRHFVYYHKGLKDTLYRLYPRE